jgi:hypothetical protein
MKLFITLMFLSAASTNASNPADEMPCASGLLRGRADALHWKALNAMAATMQKVFMLVILVFWSGNKVYSTDAARAEEKLSASSS